MKLIEGFSNYAVSERGEVVNVRTGKKKIATDNRSGGGYLYVDLYDQGRRQRAFVHRLVAQAYLANPDKKPYVNHIDGNTKNNDASNLEWVTPKENVSHAAKTLCVMRQYEAANSKRKKAIRGRNVVTGEETRTYECICDAARELRIPSSNIVANLKGRQSHTRGITWMYVEGM